MITKLNQFIAERNKQIANATPVNEENLEEGLGKFFTGKDFVGKDEEFEKRKTDFNSKLEAIEAKVKAKPDAYQFNKEEIVKKATDNNYLGTLAEQASSSGSKKIFVVYREGKTGAAKIAGGLNTKGNTVGA